MLQNVEQQRIADSIQKEELKAQLNNLKSTDKSRIEELQTRLKEIEDKENRILEEKKQQIEFLRNITTGYPVVGVLGDTLFHIYSKRGELSAKDRAAVLTKKKELYEDDYLNVDSFKVFETADNYTIHYGKTIVLSLNEADALWHDKNLPDLGNEYRQKIINSITKSKYEYSLSRTLNRTGFVILVILLTRLFIWLIRIGNRRMMNSISSKKEKWLKKTGIQGLYFS